MVTARGGQSASTISSIAPATFWALALHSRMTLAEPSRNWIRYCIVKVELEATTLVLVTLHTIRSRRPVGPAYRRRLACPSRAPQQARADALQTKRPAGDRAAMNKHHPYALGDDPPSPSRKDALQFVQWARRRGMDVRPQIAGFLIRRKVGVFRHPSCGIEPDPMSGPLRHNERNAPPVRGRPTGVRCPVGQDHVTLALACLRIRLAAMIADQGLGVGLREPVGLAPAPQPCQHFRPLSPTAPIAA